MCRLQDDDALRRAAFETMSSVIQYLPVPLLDRAYGWLSAISATRYDEVTVSAIKNFTMVWIT